MRLRALSRLFAACAALAPAAASFAALLTPIATTGHDQDIVFETGLAAAATGANGELGSRQFFEDGAVAPDDDGLPRMLPAYVSALTGDTINYDFQPFENNNILKFETATATKTLSLVTPTPYRSLAVVFSGGSLATSSETAVLSYQINYAGGGAQTGTLNAPDWGAVPTLPAGTERLFTADRTTANATTWPVSSDNNTTANRWAIYVSQITTNNTVDNIVSVDFGPATLTTATASGLPLNSGDDVVVFGLSGAVVPEPTTAALAAAAAALFRSRRHRAY